MGIFQFWFVNYLKIFFSGGSGGFGHGGGFGVAGGSFGAGVGGGHG